MEKTFSSLKPLVDVDGKSKFCLKCGSKATKEAIEALSAKERDGRILLEIA